MTEQNGEITLKSIAGTNDYEQPTFVGRNWLFNGRHGEIEARSGNVFGDKYDLVNSFIEIKNFDDYDHFLDIVDSVILESRFSNTSAVSKFILENKGNTYFFDMDNSTHNVVSAVKAPGVTINFKDYFGGSNYLARDPHEDGSKRWIPYTEDDSEQIAQTIDNYIKHGGILKNSLPQTIAAAENTTDMQSSFKELNQDGKVLAQAFATFASDGSITPSDEQKVSAIAKDLKDANIQIAPDKKSALIFDATSDLRSVTIKVPNTGKNL